MPAHQLVPRIDLRNPVNLKQMILDEQNLDLLIKRKKMNRPASKYHSYLI